MLTPPTSTTDHELIFDSGKYSVKYTDGPNGILVYEALRYGEKWRDLVGDNLVRHFVVAIHELKASLRSREDHVIKLVGELEDLREFKREVDGDGLVPAARVAVMQQQLDEAGRQLDALLNHCPINECSECAKIICPHRDDMHFHHDGCPSCAQAAEAALDAESVLNAAKPPVAWGIEESTSK